MKRSDTPERTMEWLEQAYPQLHYLLLALEGDEPALSWLSTNSPGVALLTRALAGDRNARAALENGPVDLDDLFELVDNEDLAAWLSQRRPEAHLLFLAIKGDESAATQLKKRRPAYAKLAGALRERHDRFLAEDHRGVLEGEAVADVGCLIGEMHLRQGEYEKAIEAFTRAIESSPSPDLFEGRARAYRGLAARDEGQSKVLRGRA